MSRNKSVIADFIGNTRTINTHKSIEHFILLFNSEIMSKECIRVKIEAKLLTEIVNIVI